MRVWDPRVPEAVLSIEPKEGEVRKSPFRACLVMVPTPTVLPRLPEIAGLLRSATPLMTRSVCCSPPFLCQQRKCVSVYYTPHSQHRAIVAGYDNGDVKLFDLRTSSLRCVIYPVYCH